MRFLIDKSGLNFLPYRDHLLSLVCLEIGSFHSLSLTADHFRISLSPQYLLQAFWFIDPSISDIICDWINGIIFPTRDQTDHDNFDQIESLEWYPLLILVHVVQGTQILNF